MTVTAEDVKMFLGKRIKLNIIVNGLDRYYSQGDIIRVNDDSFLFRDKFGALVSVTFDSVVKLEEKLNFVNGHVEGEWKGEV
jgi:ribosome maturation factor RimP